jgi:hypothetical protein
MLVSVLDWHLGYSGARVDQWLAERGDDGGDAPRDGPNAHWGRVSRVGVLAARFRNGVAT